MSGNTRFHINLKIMQTESVRGLVSCLGELKLLRPTKRIPYVAYKTER